MKNSISKDSIEMRIRTSVSSSMLSGKQNVYIYMVRKGDSKKKRIEKMENEVGAQFTLTTFTYDTENNMKTMKVSVMKDGVETVVLTEILLLRHSRNFADRLFEF